MVGGHAASAADRWKSADRLRGLRATYYLPGSVWMGLSGQPNSQEKDSCISCARMGKRGAEMGGWGGRVSGWVGLPQTSPRPESFRTHIWAVKENGANDTAQQLLIGGRRFF